jgi:hypothetical protein
MKAARPVVKAWPEALNKQRHISREPNLITRHIVQLAQAGCLDFQILPSSELGD